MADARDTQLISNVFSKIINKDGYAFDNIFDKVPVLKYLLARDKADGDLLGANNRVRKLDGGIDIEMPLEYAVGTSMQYFDGVDTITFTLKDTDTNAKYDWKHAAQTLVLDNKDILKIKGNSAKITNYVGGKLRNTNKSMATTLNASLTALSPASKAIHSIPILVDYAPTGAGTIGGINQALGANSWWRNQIKASGATSWELLVSEIESLRNSIAYNMSGDAPDLFLTNQTVYELLVKYMRSKGTHNFINKEMSNVLKVDVPMASGMNVVWDTGVVEPAEEATHSAGYLLNTDYLQFCMHQDRQFKLEGPENLLFSQGQDATAWVIMLMGNLTCSNRSKQGVIYSIDDSLAS